MTEQAAEDLGDLSVREEEKFEQLFLGFFGFIVLVTTAACLGVFRPVSYWFAYTNPEVDQHIAQQHGACLAEMGVEKFEIYSGPSFFFLGNDVLRVEFAGGEVIKSEIYPYRHLDQSPQYRVSQRDGEFFYEGLGGGSLTGAFLLDAHADRFSEERFAPILRMIHDSHQVLVRWGATASVACLTHPALSQSEKSE